MTITVFKSTDTNAPPLSGAAGTLTDVLQACLVDGYGSVFASGTITSNGTNVSDGDTVTIDDVTYRFKTAIAAINDVLIGASAAASLANLNAAINLWGTSGTTYFAATKTPSGAWASNLSTTVVTLKARKGGTGGNSLTLSKSAVTLTVAAFSGGSGSNTTAAAGWSNPFNGTGGQRVFRAGSGVQQYWHFDDSSPNVTAPGLSREAQFRGSETATAFQTGTGFFPTTAQIALGSGVAARKSATLDTTPSAWRVIADDRTAYLFAFTNDGAGLLYSIHIGEFYSLLNTTDSYRSLLIGRATTASGTSANEVFGSFSTLAGSSVGHYIPRVYSGGGSAVNMAVGPALTPAAQAAIGVGTIAGVDPATGDLLLSPIFVYDTLSCRGRMRGGFCSVSTAGTFGDGDTIDGSGAYAGRTFYVVKSIVGGGGQLGAFMLDITGPWETN